MAVKRIKWSSLLNLTELEFIPAPPKVLEVSDELVQTISWLTAATGHDRRLLRCTENGALLVANTWEGLSEVVDGELYVVNDTGDTFSTVLENKGVLIATSTAIVKLSIRQIAGGDIETVYVPPAWLYWYPHKVYSIKAETVPDDTGVESYVGIVAFG